MSRKILYILNRASREGKAGGVWDKLQDKSQKSKGEVLEIQAVKDPVKRIKDTIQIFKPDVVAIAGGDGTVNMVVSAIINLKNKPVLSILPMGFGNALSYCFGVETMEKALEVLLNSKHQKTIDLLKTNINGKIGVFHISLGYEARVVHNRAHYRYIGQHSYTVAAIKSLVEHKEKPLIVTVDGKVTFKSFATCLLISNSPTIGKNVVVSQDAKMNDQLMDCAIFSSKFSYLSNMRMKGFIHPFYNDRGKVLFRAERIKIEGEPYVQIDGDPVEHVGPLEIEVLPKAVTFLCNSIENIKQEYKAFVE